MGAKIEVVAKIQPVYRNSANTPWRDAIVEVVDMEIDEVSEVSEIEYRYEKEYPDKEIGAFVTWCNNPSTSVMLHYLIDGYSLVPIECLIRPENTTEWQTIERYADKSIPRTDTAVKWYKADNLIPNTIYETKLKYHEKVHKFKTMPATHTRDIKVLITSDQMNDELVFKAEAPQGFQAMHDNDIDCIILAGDGVHDQNDFHNRWTLFWEEYFKASILNDGFMIPVITALGNHDGRATPSTLLWYTNGATKDSVMYHYNFFSNLTDEGYGTVDIGDYLSLVCLNSGHTAPVNGTQTTWLQSALQARQGRHIFPFFHVAPYPGHYPFTDSIKTDIRTYWEPLFAQYGVKVGGVGHEHVSMVTKKVKQGTESADGITYVGQGFGMGCETRTGNLSTAWYIDYFSDTTRDFDVIEFKPDGSVGIKQIGFDGAILYSNTI